MEAGLKSCFQPTKHECIQNYLEKILYSSLSPSLACFPTHPVSVKQDLESILGIHIGYLWHQPHIWNLKQPMIYLHMPVQIQRHMKPFPTLCREQWLRTHPVDVLPDGEEKTPGILQGKNCICSGSRRGHYEWCFLILLQRLALFWIKFNHSKEQKQVSLGWATSSSQSQHKKLQYRLNWSAVQLSSAKLYLFFKNDSWVETPFAVSHTHK